MADIVDRLRDRAYSMYRKDQLCEEAAAVIASLRLEIRTQRMEIAGLREERCAIIAADQPPDPYAKSITKDGISNTDGRIWISTEHPPD